MAQSNIKVATDNFFNNIKFNKECHITYNNLLNNNIEFNYELFIYFILQTAFQMNFNGSFDELYIDVIKRRTKYKRQIIKNFEIAYLGEPTRYNKFIKLFNCYRKANLTDKEIMFHRSIDFVDFDKTLDECFELKNEKKQKRFIEFCEYIYNNLDRILDSKKGINIKNKKRVTFKF